MTNIQRDEYQRVTHLRGKARKVATSILELLDEFYADFGWETGGCRMFYTPAEWRKRGEEYGCSSLLVVCHDGGEHAPFFNIDYGEYTLHERLQNMLREKHQVFVEQCTSWYSAVYEI